MGACLQIETPRTLGKYPLLEKLGEGLLGPVYKSCDRDLGRAVAIRVLCDGIKWDAQLEESFYRECRAASALQHPNIAAVFEAGQDGQSRYIVMELLGGKDLKSLIAEDPDMPVEAKVSIMIAAAEALSHAHKNGVLHRSLEPGKIRLTAEGVKIRDLGISGPLMKRLPRPVVRWGVPIYLSPEQIQQQSGNAQSDVFSAGIVFYELLTRRHPFHDPDGNKALDNLLLDPQIATFEQYPDLPPGLWAILRKCLSKNPSDRYAGMDEFAGACRELMKDLAEDVQLMMAELHSSLPLIRKAAGGPDAPEAAVQLLNEIESLMHGRKEADYISLDRLVTSLMEQHPAIKKAAGSMQPWESRIFAAADLPALPAPVQPVSVEGASPVFLPGAGDPAKPEENLRGQEGEGAGRSFPPPAKNEEPSPWAYSSVANASTRVRRGLAPNAGWRCGRIPAPSYRSVAALLSILLIATAVYVVLGTDAGGSVRRAGRYFIADLHKPAIASAPAARLSLPAAPEKAQAADSKIDRMNLAVESPVFPLKDPAKEPDPRSGSSPEGPKQLLAKISGWIDSGNLPKAKVELDKLQKDRPKTPGIAALRKKYEARERAQSEQEQKAARRQRENEWLRQVSDLFLAGKYNEVSGILSLWLAEDPGNAGAREFATKNEEIQRALKAYSSAITENRYPDALAAIGRAEKVNPADSTFSELRQNVESKRAAARASLTVHRLGDKAALLLDGKPIGRDGEAMNENVPIGSHTLAIESQGFAVSSRVQEFNEGEQAAFVYDLARRNLRPMVESDRELLARRKLAEDVHYFDVEHEHGILRGSCRGALMLNYLDLEFRPVSGSHGFRIPTGQLNLRIAGRNAEFAFASDGSRFQSFKFPDGKAAEKFLQKWNELKSKAPE